MEAYLADLPGSERYPSFRNRRIYCMGFGQYWIFFCAGEPSVPSQSHMRFLFCRSHCRQCRNHAHRKLFIPQSGFLQIPPHNGRPCPWLTVPTAKPVADFHRQVIEPAERTRKDTASPVRWGCVCINSVFQGLFPFYMHIRTSLFSSASPMFYRFYSTARV